VEGVHVFLDHAVVLLDLFDLIGLSSFFGLCNSFGDHTSLSFSLLDDLLLSLVDLILFLLELEGELNGLVDFSHRYYIVDVINLIMMSHKVGLLKSDSEVLSLLGISKLLVDLILSQLLALLLIELNIPLLEVLWHVDEQLELFV